MGSVGGFNRCSKGDFLVEYGLFECRVAGCWGCVDRSAVDGNLEIQVVASAVLFFTL
jgi:hypothetical protein